LIIRQQRKAINPAFHFDTIKEFVPSFYNKTEQLMHIWNGLKNHNVVVTDWMHKFTLDVLGDTVFGHDFNSLSGDGEDHFESYNRIIGYFSKPKNLILSLLEMKLGLKIQYQLYDAVKDLRSMCEGIISEKMEQKRLGAKPTKGHYDIVDMMLDAEPKMDLQALVANIFIFFLAGHETTASALAWQFYYLGNYPKVQQKAREEVDRVIQGRPITHEMLKELQYLSCVIKEGLRINPPAALIATRYVADDTEFEGVKIPKGCRIGLAHETIHHLPEFWHEPEVFNPDRFLKENWLSTEGDEHHLKQHPFAYLPFSLKSRACIGNQFSLIEQMVFLASLLHHFEFKTKEIEWPTGSQALVKPDKVVVELLSRTFSK
jgi:cytochrome P450